MAGVSGLPVVGAAILVNDNDTWMWDDDDPRLPRCPVCGYRTNFFATNPDYVPKARFKPVYAPELAITKQTAMASTYDGQVIVTRLFKEFCQAQGYEGLEFRGFCRDPEHFHFVATRQVQFDTKRSGTRFEKQCPRCGNYESIVPAQPAIIKVPESVADAILRTDLLFASGDEKNPVIIVGHETARKIKSAGFRGISFGPVYGSGNE